MKYTVKTLTELRKMDTMKARVRRGCDMVSQRHKDWLLHMHRIEAQNWDRLNAIESIAKALKEQK